MLIVDNPLISILGTLLIIIAIYVWHKMEKSKNDDDGDKKQS